MESKIFIDISETGEPFIFVKHVHSEDLRDRLLGRFLLQFEQPESERTSTGKTYIELQRTDPETTVAFIRASK